MIYFIQKYVLEVLRWLLPRNTFLVSKNANPANEINCIQWNKVGDEYELSPKNDLAPKLQGFYMLELACGSSSSQSLALFTSKCTEGKNVNIAFKLRFLPGKTSKRIVYFDQPTSNFVWSLLDDTGEITAPNFRFVKLSRGFSLKRIKEKLDRKGFLSLNNDNKLNVLYQKYNDLFSKRISGNYSDWIVKKEPVIWLNNIINNGPLFSVVVPVFNVKSQWLIACVESVQSQSYSNWQLILVDDASTSSDTIAALKDIQGREDPRISVVFRQENGHISAATNTGISRATGDYLVLLDHDDTLAPQALNELASAIHNNHNAKLIYSDEDLIDEAGNRLTPHFKPDWNPELLLGHNYITHLCCYYLPLVRELGGMTMGLEGAQDYDLVLRVSEVVNASQIVHIAKILYHWRMIEGSTASDANAKSYATNAGLQALKNHIERQNINATVRHANQTNFYQVNWPLPSENLLVSIIIPTKNGLDVLKPCIESIFRTIEYKEFEILLVDNNSDDFETLEYMASLQSNNKIKILSYNKPFNYSKINNYAAKHAQGDILLLLNNDVEAIESGWFEEMLAIAVRKEVGCVGAKLLYPDGTIQHAGVIMGLGGYAAHSHRGYEGSAAGYANRLNVRQNLSAVTAACLMVKKSVYQDLSGLDEDFEVAYNDVDFCLRVQRAGYRNVFTPFAKLIHHESKTRGQDTGASAVKRFSKEKALLLSRWQEIIQHDPAYNPNLSRDNEEFSL